MYPPGHLAINGLFVAAYNALPNVRSIPLWPAVVAAILPDITDKVATDFLHWMPYGRNYLHNLTAAVAGGIILALLLRSRGAGISWCIGLIGHLVGDFVFVPLFWPWVGYEWPDEYRNIAAGVVQTVTDVAGGHPLSELAASVWHFRRIGVECIMLGGMFHALQPWVMKHRIPFWTRVTAMLFALAAWGYIVVEWEYPAFLNYVQFYTIK
ncbi:MAG: metal-dependent hydrolase [Desulfamplus sp.]|nr:metal-dependent hydrolase [Desulfamplus sp.]